MNDKISGIILEASAYKENDLLLKVFIEDGEIISLIGKGSQKMSAHNHYVPFSLYEFIIDIKENKTMYTPKSAKLIKSYYIDNDLKMLSFNNLIANALIKNKEELDFEDYSILLFILEKENDRNMYCLGSLFFARLLKKSGIEPIVDGCVECSNSKVIGLSKSLGGFVCKDHAQEQDLEDVIRLKKFRLINKANFDNYDVVSEYDYDEKDLELLVDFYLENSYISLQAYDFFKKI